MISVRLEISLALAFVLSLTCLCVQAADSVYKTEDEYGRPVFSDRGSESSREVTLEEPMIFESRKLPKPARQRDEAPEDAGSIRFDRLAITSPANETAVRSNPGNVTLQIEIAPKPNPRFQAQLTMDGLTVRQIGESGPVTLTNVDRGSHVFAIEVTDTTTGKVVATSDPVTLSVLRYHRPPG